MPINFPNSPSPNQQYTYDNKTWEWNGIYWEVYSALTSYITSAYTVGNGVSDISGVTGGNIALKSFSGVNITIIDGSDKLTFSGTPSFSISGSNNQVLTSNGSGGAVAESLLTFDGTVSSPTLDVNSVCIGRGNGNDSSNISIGDVAFKLPVSLLDNNVSIGKSTLKNLSTGSNNIGIGTSSLEGCCISANFCDNIAIGRNSQKRRSGGVNNISLGNDSQYYSASGSNNISLGASTLIDNKADNNISLGVNSQRSNINGTKNISIGTNSMRTSCDGDSNIAIGYDSLRQNLNKSDFNIAIGQSSMYYNINQYNDFNISIGRCALLCNNSGSGNIAIGRRALAGSTAYGNRGSYNIAMGRGSMYLNDYGSFNIAIGRSSLYSNDNGSKNVSVGFRSTVNSTRASYLISIGYKSLYYNTSGANNISIGYKSLYYNTTGSNNIAIGCNTNSNNFRSSIIIGHNAYATAGNQLVIGSSSFPAGTITYESCTSYRTWQIIINGNSYKVLLA